MPGVGLLSPAAAHEATGNARPDVSPGADAVTPFLEATGTALIALAIRGSRVLPVWWRFGLHNRVLLDGVTSSS